MQLERASSCHATPSWAQKAAMAIENIQRSAACLKQRLENEYRKRATAEDDVATLQTSINDMEEDKEIQMKALDKKTRDLEMSHASDERHQRELAAHKRFRGPDLEETIKTYFVWGAGSGQEHPDLALIANPLYTVPGHEESRGRRRKVCEALIATQQHQWRLEQRPAHD